MHGQPMKNSVTSILGCYPEDARFALMYLRTLIYQVARDLDIEPPEEDLKWGEPAYSVRGGSTLRIDWKPDHPDAVWMFFHCRTRLVDTFRELYGDQLTFSGNRAIRLPLDQPLPETALKHCVALALRYHRLKNLPLLGA